MFLIVFHDWQMSIDCLLDRTIKHMMFLESVTKQSDRIKQAEEPKVRIKVMFFSFIVFILNNYH